MIFKGFIQIYSLNYFFLFKKFWEKYNGATCKCASFELRPFLKHSSLQENQNIYWKKSKKKYWKNPLCFSRNEAITRCWLLFWKYFFLLSWTRHIGRPAFPSCQFHKFLTLKLSQFHGWVSKKFYLWIFNGCMDDEVKLVVLTHRN